MAFQAGFDKTLSKSRIERNLDITIVYREP